MATKRSSFDPVTHVLIVRNAAKQKVNGMGSRGDLDYAKRLALSLLRLDRTCTSVSVDIYPYDAKTSWQDLEPLATVSLDEVE